jgi:hypothetical protein
MTASTEKYAMRNADVVADSDRFKIKNPSICIQPAVVADTAIRLLLCVE